jgi:hypothetical protein
MTHTNKNTSQNKHNKTEERISQQPWVPVSPSAHSPSPKRIERQIKKMDMNPQGGDWQ